MAGVMIFTPRVRALLYSNVNRNNFCVDSIAQLYLNIKSKAYVVNVVRWDLVEHY